jgi:hypothetical protein
MVVRACRCCGAVRRARPGGGRWVERASQRCRVRRGRALSARVGGAVRMADRCEQVRGEVLDVQRHADAATGPVVSGVWGGGDGMDEVGNEVGRRPVVDRDGGGGISASAAPARQHVDRCVVGAVEASSRAADPPHGVGRSPPGRRAVTGGGSKPRCDDRVCAHRRDRAVRVFGSGVQAAKGGGGVWVVFQRDDRGGVE